MTKFLHYAKHIFDVSSVEQITDMRVFGEIGQQLQTQQDIFFSVKYVFQFWELGVLSLLVDASVASLGGIDFHVGKCRATQC